MESSVADWKKLTPGELLKPGREGRGQTLVYKIQKGEDFILADGKTIKFKNDKKVVGAIQAGLEQKSNALLNAISLTGADGNSYKISDIAKTPEFGGKGAGSGTRAEDEALSDIKRKLEDILKATKKSYINVKIGKRTVKCAGFESTFGTPKSDFHILDPDNNQVAWISHKKGTKAKDFQQYGGMIELKDNANLQKFVSDVKDILGKTKSNDVVLPMKTAFARKVTDKSVRMKSLFGKDFRSSGPDSVQNIDVLYQGVLGFKKVGNAYEITSSHTVFHGQEPTGDYTPYYYVRPEQAKNQFGVRGARFFIVSKLTALGNKNTTEI